MRLKVLRFLFFSLQNLHEAIHTGHNECSRQCVHGVKPQLAADLLRAQTFQPEWNVSRSAPVMDTCFAPLCLAGTHSHMIDLFLPALD